MPNIDKDDLMSSYLHASGRGISAVPHEGAGLWDSLKGFAKHVYKFGAPIVQKTAKSFARDVVSGLSKQLENPRMMEI